MARGPFGFADSSRAASSTHRFSNERGRRDAAIHALGERVTPRSCSGLTIEEPQHVARDGTQWCTGRHLRFGILTHAVDDRLDRRSLVMVVEHRAMQGG